MFTTTLREPGYVELGLTIAESEIALLMLPDRSNARWSALIAFKRLSGHC
jgi:hypothetical protein